MRDKEIRNWLETLIATLGEPRRSVDPEPLRLLFKERKYPEMVSMIKRQMRLDLRVGLQIHATSEIPGAAWISRPVPMPTYGTAQFAATKVVVHLNGVYLRRMTLETIVFAIAHELSHVLLDAIHHTLREQEEAVDLTAMILGYGNFYLHGSLVETRELNPGMRQLLRLMKLEQLKNDPDFLRNWGDAAIARFGYLSREEIRYARKLLMR